MFLTLDGGGTGLSGRFGGKFVLVRTGGIRRGSASGDFRLGSAVTLRGRRFFAVLLGQETGDQPEVVGEDRPAHGQRTVREAFLPQAPSVLLAQDRDARFRGAAPALETGEDFFL